MKINQLGKTDIYVSEAGFGVLTMGSSQLNLPIEAGAELISYAVSKGINFFDTAQYYETYEYLRRGLELAKQRKYITERDDVVICSKSLVRTYDEMQLAVDEALEELKLDAIDIFLLHEVRQEPDWELRKEAWQCLLDNKKAGKIKAVGVSTHHIDVVWHMADIEECDVVFPLINYAGMGIRKGSEQGDCQEMAAAIEKCHDSGKGIFAMKAFGGGNLTANYQKALDYVYGLTGIDSVMIGIGKAEELDQLVDYAEGRMPKDFQPDVSGKKVRIDLSSCEGCGRCKERCPNKAIDWGPHGLAEIDQNICLTCGYCAPVCPVRAIVMY